MVGEYLFFCILSFRYRLMHMRLSRYLLNKAGTRVALDMTTLTIMRYLPREVDPLVYNMTHEDPGNVTYSSIGGRILGSTTSGY